MPPLARESPREYRTLHPAPGGGEVDMFAPARHVERDLPAVWGLGFEVWGSGFGVEGLGLRVEG